jgi:hypothetical protein
MAADFSVAELAQALEHASDAIKVEVGKLVEQAAFATRDKVQLAYPVGPTGRLRRDVRIGQPRSFLTSSTGVNSPARTVRASAPHVHIWQEGTVQRFDATRANANRGRSPWHGRVFEAIAARERADMLRSAQALLDRDREL